MFDDRKVVDFADFCIEGVRNRKTAGELSIIIMAHVGIDELTFYDNDLPYTFATTVGTGADSNPYHVQTQGIQRSILASHFASFAAEKYSHCYLAIAEYHCLKQLYDYLKDDYCLHSDLVNKQCMLLKTVLDEFEREYVRVDPTFLFTVLKQ